MKSQGAAKNEANNAAKAEPIAAKVVVPVEEAAAPAKVEIDFSNVEVEPLFEEMVDFDTFSKSDFRTILLLPESYHQGSEHSILLFLLQGV